MPYAAELDDLRQEVRAGVAGVVSFWPKIDGSGNVAASATGNTFEIRSPAGVLLAGPTSIAPTAVGAVSRFDIDVPAISVLGEDYTALLSWRTSPSATPIVEGIAFDVVREPWGPSSVSLNSMQALVPDIGERLERQGVRLSQSAEQRASVVGHQARVELGDWLRSAVADDLTRMSSAISAAALLTQQDAYLRPRLIKDKARLHAIEVRLAIHFAFAADRRSDKSDSAIGELAEHWLKAARTSFKAMGALKYDLNDDQVVDAEVSEIGRFIPVRRVQS